MQRSSERAFLRASVGLRTLAVLLLALLGGCALVGVEAPEPPPPAVAEGPALTEGVATAEEDAEAAALLAEAEALLGEGAWLDAIAITDEIRERLPTAQGSAGAYRLEAEARYGLREWERGVEAMEAYLGRLEPTDPLRADGLFFLAHLRLEGEMDGALEALFDVPETSPPEVRERALERARRTASSLDETILRGVVDGAPDHPWLLPVFQVELAERRALVGDSGAARVHLDAARSLEPASGEVERIARIEAGDLAPEGELSGTLGSILSLDGSPTLQRLSEQIRDGIEIALLDEGIRGAVQLAQEEDRGSASASVAGVRTLESRATFGIIGPLTETGFREAAQARGSNTPMISPVAPVSSGGGEGAFSLTGVDPDASRTLARLALDQGFREVAILHSNASDESAEAGWFRQAFEAGGGRVVQTLAYGAGSSDFRGQLAQIESRAPDALAVFAGPGELPILGAQLLYLGDEAELEIPILGSSTWASDQTLQNLPRSQTNGVLSVAPHAGAGYGPRWAAFVDAYEGHFRRTLREPIPALGYDAVLLLVEGARLGGGTSPAEVLEGIRAIDQLAGATGTFAFEEGRIVRRHIPVQLRNGERIPL